MTRSELSSNSAARSSSTADLFYYGIKGTPKLVARSSHLWESPPVSTEGPWGTPVPVRILPIGTEHPIVSAYESIYPEIEAACAGLDWRSISCYRIGWKVVNEENPVVVWIFLNPNASSTPGASNLVDSICEILRSKRMDDVHVQVAEARSSSNLDDDLFPPPNIDDAYTSHPPVGSSLGPKRSDTAGSLGFYIKLSKADESIYAAVTCHHVACNIPDPDVDTVASVPWSTEKNQRKFEVTCPSEKDYKVHVNAREIDCKHFRASISASEKVKAQSISSDGSTTWSQTNEESLLGFTSALAKVEDSLKRARSFFAKSSRFGCVMGSSGLHQPSPGEGMMDWAVIELDAARTTTPEDLTNKLPASAATRFYELMRFVGRREDDVERWADLLHTISRDKSEMVRVAELNDRLRSGTRTEVFLLGRTSGAAVGHLNELRDGLRTTYPMKNGSRKTVISREYVVLDYGTAGSKLASRVPTFSEKGDSGSPVFDKDGRLVGILFAGHGLDHLGHPASWVSPVETIFAHIKDSMGSESYAITLL